MTLLLAFGGVARADELTVHNGSATNNYVPIYGLWADAYLKCEMVYPASEFGNMDGGTISSMTFYASSPAAAAWTGTFQVFLKEVSTATISEFSGTEGATIVYEGALDATGSTMEIVFTTPYTYNGGNLLVGVYQTVKGNYKSVTWAGENVTGASVQGYSSSSLDGVSPTQRDFLPKTTFNYTPGDYTFYNITVTANPTDGGTVTGGGSYREGRSCTIVATPGAGFDFVNWMKGNQVVATDSLYTFTVTQDADFVANFQIKAPELSLNPDTIKLGDRPAGAWMRPYTVTLSNANTAGAAQITNMQFQGTGGDALGVDLGNLTIPFTLNSGASKSFDVTWGEQAATVNGTLKVDYQNAAHTGSKTFLATATIYTPVIGDVWEQPFEVNSFPYTETVTAAPFYNNYILPYPSLEDGKDVVYKLVFDEDTQLSASVTEGENGKMVLYEESFKGLGGPDMTNRYTGPTLSTRGDRVETELTVYEGTATNNYVPAYMFYFDDYTRSQYVIPAEDLAEMGGTTISSVKFYTTSSNVPYTSLSTVDVYLMEVGYTTISAFEPKSSATIVYSGTLDVVSAGDGGELTIEFTTPYAYNGGNLLVGIENTTDAGYKNIYFYGQSVTGASVSGYNGTSLEGVTPTQRNFIPKTTFVYDNGATGIGITDMTVAAGTYYLVASSTSNTFSVSIETSALSCPEVVSNPTPADSALNVSDINTLLKWKLGDRTTEYCLRFGTSATNLETLVDWTRELKEQYKFTDTLNYHTTYYWQVCERNDGCPNGVEGPVWSFTTALNAPTNLTSTLGSVILEGETLRLAWKAPAEHRSTISYNIYRRTGSYYYSYDSIGHTNDTLFDITGLENASTSSTYSSYTYCVKAVYPQGMSAYSNACTVYVYETGTVNGHVYEQDENTPVAGAKANFKLSGRVFSFTTNNAGAYTGTLAAASYSASNVYATAEGYTDTYYDSPVNVTADGTVDDINFVLDEIFYPPTQVAANYHPDPDDYESGSAKVTWSAPNGTRQSNTPLFHAMNEETPAEPINGEGGDRSLQYYRVFRTTYDNNGPYNADNTVVIADNVTGTNLSVIDPSFDTLSDGVYKYGVSCVYAGNRGGQNRTILLSENFEEGIPSSWTLVDADDDGEGWVIATPTEYGIGEAHSGSNVASSWSWNNTSYDPDNYMITPLVEGARSMTYFAATNTGYPDHYGVYVSTTNTELSSFTQVYEETWSSLSAKGNGTKSSIKQSGTREISEWMEITVDLPEGTKYVAFRHYDSYDNNYLFIDDVEISDVVYVPFTNDRESEIAWSNAMDRGQWLYDAVSLTVTLNTGNSPDSTQVMLVQPLDQYEANRMDSTQLDFYLDETGTYTWDRFRKGLYGIMIFKEGYDPITEILTIAHDTALVYQLKETIEKPTNLYVSRTGWAMWEGLGEGGLELSNDSTGTGTRDFVGIEVMLTDMDGDTIYTGITDKNYMQLPTEDLTDDEFYICSVRHVYSTGKSKPAFKTWIYQSCELFSGIAEPVGVVNETGAILNWVYPEPDTTGTRTVNNDENWYYYDNGEYATRVGLGSSGVPFYWGIMIPAGSYEGNYITSVTAYDCMAMTGTLTIFNDGTTAPADDMAQTDVTFTGAGEFVTFDFNPVEIDPSKNVWVVFYNASGATYPAAASVDVTGDPNGRWIGFDSDDWTDLALVGVPGYSWMIHAQITTIDPDPSPVGDDYLGTAIFRDGEWIGFTSGWNFVDAEGTIENEYELRLVYDGDKLCPNNNSYYTMSCPQAVELALQQFTITATCDPAEAGTVMGAGTYMMGDTCTLIATANPGYEFVLWMLDGEMVGEYYEPEYSFVVTEDGDYVAVFEQIDYYIYTIAVPEAGGILEGEGSYYYGDTCTLIATANEGYDFVNWTRMIYGGDEPEEVVVSTDPTYVFVINDETAAGGDETEYYAHFALKTFEITVLANPAEGGEVTGAGTYAYGDTVVLTAVSAEGYTFINWLKDGEQASIDSTYTFTMDENGGGYYEAQFSQNDYVVTAIADPEEGGMVTGTGPYNYGDTCTLVATPNPSYGFINWTLEGVEVSTETTYTFIVTGNASYVANFELLTITQSSHFDNGWTWWSSYIEEDGDTCLMQLEQGLGASGLIIKTQTNSLTHVGNGWFGPITALDNAQTYRVKTNAEADVDITGLPVVTASHPVTLNPNWTWIGYPCTTEMTVAEALAGITPSAGDVLKSQTSSTVYLGTMWAGALNTLTPGMGLMYKSSRSDAVTLTFPTGAKGGELKPNLTAENNHWQPNTSAYPDNMTVLAVVELDGVELQGENYELAAFANGECRGSVQLLYIEPLNRYMAVLTVSGDEAAELHFGLYDNFTGEEILGAEESLTYQTNAVVGGVDELFTIHFRGFTGLYEFKLVDIFPNPVRRGELFNIGIAAEEVGVVRVETVNALGAVISSETSTGMPANFKAPNVPGIYTLRISVEGKETCYRKLVVE